MYPELSNNSTYLLISNGCSFCERTEKLLEEKGIKFMAVELDNLSKEDKLKVMVERKKQDLKEIRLPIIYHKGTFYFNFLPSQAEKILKGE
ncbi:MAG: glutaredoxin domain-containing protein [Methanogenium sp.]